MKRKELTRMLENSGCVLIRHGSKHDLYRNPRTGKQQPMHRHREVDELLAKHILKILG